MTGPIVVVGDAVLDVDWAGDAERLCPDAPAAVVELRGERVRPGGAALAAAVAAASRDDDVVLAAPVGDGADARRLAELLARDGVDLLPLPARGTLVVKRRVLVQGRSLLRLDSGGCTPAPGAATVLRDLLPRARAVLVSDYAGGVTADVGVRAALADVAAPMVWDPHGRGEPPVRGTTVVTPNRAEARGWVARLGGGAGAQANPLAAARADADVLARSWDGVAVAVTLGAEGVLLRGPAGTPLLLPVEPAPAGCDTCGAGDAFAAAVTTELGKGMPVAHAVAAAAREAARFVAAGGAAGWPHETGQQHAPHDAEAVVRATRGRGGRLVATGGCFDLLHAGHIETLAAARRLGDALVVLLNSDTSVRLQGKGSDRPLQPEQDRRRVLEALACVDAVVVFDEATPDEALRRVRPDVWAKGGDYASRGLPEQAVLDEWGGQAVVLPYWEGRSTTALVEAARRHGRTVPAHTRPAQPTPGRTA